MKKGKKKKKQPVDSRITLAKQVLRLLKNKDIKPSDDPGVFLDFSKNDSERLNKHYNTNLFARNVYRNLKFFALNKVKAREVLNRKTQACKVCVTGALGYAYVTEMNDIAANRAFFLDEHSGTFFHLTKLFKRADLIFMEFVYELGKGYFHSSAVRYRLLKYHYYSELEDASVLLNNLMAWGKKFRSKKSRLEAIMQNVIDNNGRFLPVEGMK